MSLNGVWRDLLPSTIIAGPLLRGFPAAWFPWCDGGGGGAWSGCIQRKPESKKVGSDSVSFEHWSIIELLFEIMIDRV